MLTGDGRRCGEHPKQARWFKAGLWLRLCTVQPRVQPHVSRAKRETEKSDDQMVLTCSDSKQEIKSHRDKQRTGQLGDTLPDGELAACNNTVSLARSS